VPSSVALASGVTSSVVENNNIAISHTETRLCLSLYPLQTNIMALKLKRTDQNTELLFASYS
jgi:hypothetical protein